MVVVIVVEVIYEMTGNGCSYKSNGEVVVSLQKKRLRVSGAAFEF